MTRWIPRRFCTRLEYIFSLASLASLAPWRSTLLLPRSSRHGLPEQSPRYGPGHTSRLDERFVVVGLSRSTLVLVVLAEVVSARRAALGRGEPVTRAAQGHEGQRRAELGA